MARKRHQGWTEAHVRRLFWRAGFGATSKQAGYWAKRSKAATIDRLLRGGSGPPRPRFPLPSVGGKPLDPINEYAHDVYWWLDRMIRTPRPLTEKMTLFWHDHFATLDQDRPLMLAQNKMLRRNALGSFRRMLTDAGLISTPLGIRVATVDAPGNFDTHDSQRDSLNELLPQISQALGAFQADLEARGVADRVLTFVWSEFGRRPHDNDSGTDHGAAAWRGRRARACAAGC